jgi:hypothetical protein
MPARCQPETNVGLGDRESAQSSGAAWPGVELRREPDIIWSYTQNVIRIAVGECAKLDPRPRCNMHKISF